MGKGKFNKGCSDKRRFKKHIQKDIGFETFTERVKRQLKTKESKGNIL